jgi:hypothetical protein
MVLFVKIMYYNIVHFLVLSYVIINYCTDTNNTTLSPTFAVSVSLSHLIVILYNNYNNYRLASLYNNRLLCVLIRL